MMENPEKLRRKPSFHGGGSTVRSTIHPERKEGVKDGQKGMENPYESDLEFESSFAWLKSIIRWFSNVAIFTLCSILLHINQWLFRCENHESICSRLG
ncbi:hypothetical protein CMV_028268 [Castanea mollissima]|uniref:Uncharacterized protein n=1 Tax=Castanea mollissima TaxID=60419 RepID=A0A8J4QHS9_9ROSI|nr:hypothetical protein CMV_028268 [Castanea mollissima]